MLTQDERAALRAVLDDIQRDEDDRVVADVRDRAAVLERQGNRLLPLRDAPLRMR